MSQQQQQQQLELINPILSSIVNARRKIKIDTGGFSRENFAREYQPLKVSKSCLSNLYGKWYDVPCHETIRGIQFLIQLETTNHSL